MFTGILILLASLSPCTSQDPYESGYDIAPTQNCSTTDDFISFHPTNSTHLDEPRSLRQQTSELDLRRRTSDLTDKVLADETRTELNTSKLMKYSLPNDWDDDRRKLDFPRKYGDERYKMNDLHLNNGVFGYFGFLRSFLSFIQPYDVPIGTNNN